MTSQHFDQAFLDEIFPASRADDFFAALFGGAEEGAYDIALVHRESSADKVCMAFELRQRPGKCLACNLTYGLPQVFQRHPILNVAGVARAVAQRQGWPVETMTWNLGHTEEVNREVHAIPLTLKKA